MEDGFGKFCFSYVYVYDFVSSFLEILKAFD